MSLVFGIIIGGAIVAIVAVVFFVRTFWGVGP